MGMGTQKMVSTQAFAIMRTTSLPCTSNVASACRLSSSTEDVQANLPGEVQGWLVLSCAGMACSAKSLYGLGLASSNIGGPDLPATASHDGCCSISKRTHQSISRKGKRGWAKGQRGWGLPASEMTRRDVRGPLHGGQTRQSTTHPGQGPLVG